MVTYTLDLTEIGPVFETFPDELAFFLLRNSTLLPYASADTLGADALFAIDITGNAGGDLSVFSPMTFVAPDSLILDGAVASVIPGDRVVGRLRFLSAAPNPAFSGVGLRYEVPEPGGLLQIRVFDVEGRLVSEPFSGKRTAGTWTTKWNAANSRGRSVPSGIYIVQIQMDGQSLVRRVVLTR